MSDLKSVGLKCLKSQSPTLCSRRMRTKPTAITGAVLNSYLYSLSSNIYYLYSSKQPVHPKSHDWFISRRKQVKWRTEPRKLILIKSNWGFRVCEASLLLACVWTTAPLMDSGPTFDVLVQLYLNSMDCATEFSFYWLHTNTHTDGGSIWASGTKQNCGSLRHGRTAAHCQLWWPAGRSSYTKRRSVWSAYSATTPRRQKQSPCPLKFALCDTKGPTDHFFSCCGHYRRHCYGNSGGKNTKLQHQRWMTPWLANIRFLL